MLEGQQGLEPVLRQFVTLKLTNMRDLDGRLFPYLKYQDLDDAWWSYVMSPKGQVYGVFGGRGERSYNEQLSADALKSVLKRVLDHHYDPRRDGWNLEGKPADLKKGKAQIPPTIKGWKAYTRDHEAYKKDPEGCIHCHHVAEAMRTPAFADKSFDIHSDFYVWPLPINIGLRIERDHGLRVKEVVKGGAADRAGVKVGDVLGAAEGRRLFGQADLRAVLHNADWDNAKIDLAWTRKGKVHEGTLKLSKGWRKSDLGYRKSVAEAKFGAHWGFSWPVAASAQDRKRRGIDAKSMAVKPWKPAGKLAGDAGLRYDDIIVAVNGKSPNVGGRSFVVWFKFNVKRGEKVTLSVVNPAGKKRDITFTTAK